MRNTCRQSYHSWLYRKLEVIVLAASIISFLLYWRNVEKQNIQLFAQGMVHRQEEFTFSPVLWNQWSINRWRAYWILNNGIILFWDDEEIGDHCREAYWCVRLNSVGEISFIDDFSRRKDYETENYNEKSDYFIEGQECTMEEWIAKAREYIYIDENGAVQVQNQVEWKELF